MGATTESPCHRPATTRVMGVPYCGRCAREQRAYFAIGETVRPQASSDGLSETAGRFLDGPLADALRGIRSTSVRRDVKKRRATVRAGTEGRHA